MKSVAQLEAEVADLRLQVADVRVALVWAIDTREVPHAEIVRDRREDLHDSRMEVVIAAEALVRAIDAENILAQAWRLGLLRDRLAEQELAWSRWIDAVAQSRAEQAS